MTQMNPQRNHKSRLLIALFSKKEELLSLYNGVRKSNYTNAEDLVVTTIDDVLYLGMKNDISFLFDYRLNLYEHQSSWNPNMPLRGLFYMSSLYRQYVVDHGLNMYSTTRIRLPAPQYIVFYNGTKDEPDCQKLRLSDSFYDIGEEPVIECVATILNINLGKNQELMERCQTLYQYSYFIAEIRKGREEGMDLSEAVEQAVETCIESNILADFLRRYRAEMTDWILTEYDEELHNRTLREEGIKCVNELVRRLLQDGRTSDLERAVRDKKFQRQLFKEYGIPYEVDGMFGVREDDM